MTFFRDLTPYIYFHPEEDPPNTVNIGWLDRRHAFPTGKTTALFRAKLKQVCKTRVKQTRGFHSCDFCKGRDKASSSAEIRVAGAYGVYAAPELVYHYVAVHGYLPPTEFIAAVMGRLLADKITRRLARAAGRDSPNRFTADELRPWVLDLLSQDNQWAEIYPEACGQPSWELWMKDTRPEDALFAVVIFCGGLEFFCGTGNATELREFKKYDPRTYPSYDKVFDEMKKRFSILAAPLKMTQTMRRHWLGGFW